MSHKLLLASVLLGFQCLFAGCAARAPETEINEDVDYPIVEDAQQSELPSITVSASDDAYSEFRKYLGEGNTVVLEKAYHMERPEVTIDFHANTKITYTSDDTLTRFSFEKPLPTLTAKKFGFTFHPTLQSVVLRPEGSGTAATSLGRYGFKWMNTEGADGQPEAADTAKPEVWAYSCQESCPLSVKKQSELAKKELEDAKDDLPFKVVWKEARPGCVQCDLPAFWFHVSEQEPNCKDAKNTRAQGGWPGIKQFTAIWKTNRSEAKRFERSKGPDTTSIGSRDRAIVTINGSRNPPRETLLSHLSNDGIHRGKHDRSFLESLSNSQLIWLHDKDHDK